VYLADNGAVDIDGAALDNGSSDICGAVSFSTLPALVTCSDIGPNNVTLTVTDGRNNSETCTSVVTVLDTIKPVARCQDIDVYLSATGTVGLVASALNNGSSDACGIASFSASATPFTCSDIGANNAMLNVTDSNGNVGSCSAVVTVVDITPPTVRCKPGIVYLDPLGNAVLDPIALDNGSYDVCSQVSFSASKTTFTCSDIGLNNVTLYVADNIGNTGYCIATVIVVDTIKPMAKCKDTLVYLGANGNFILEPIVLDNGSYDVCSPVSFSASNNIFTCSNIGFNSVTLSVTDNKGNIETCLAEVTIVDTIKPIISCQNRTVYLTENCQFIVPDYIAISNLLDNCNPSNLTFTQLPAAGTVLETFEAQNIRILGVDQSGNIDSCNFTLTLIYAPVLFCPENQEVTTNYTCNYEIEDYTSLIDIELAGCDFDDVIITQFPSAGSIVTGSQINESENSAQTRVTIVIENRSGNKDSCDFIVDVTCISPIAISEFITPNGDGLNDYLFIEGIERFPENKLLIYNRRGVVVYESSSYINTWRGQSNKAFSGNRLPEGSYFYSFQTAPGVKPLTGYIILKR
jgi:gliding motility-associated-like protein